MGYKVNQKLENIYIRYIWLRKKLTRFYSFLLQVHAVIKQIFSPMLDPTNWQIYLYSVKISHMNWGPHIWCLGP